MRTIGLTLAIAACTTTTAPRPTVVELPRPHAAPLRPAAVAPAAPEVTVEELLRAHLGDVDLRTCLGASSRREHVIRIVREGAALSSKHLGGDYNVSNCLNRLLALWGQRGVVAGTERFRLFDDRRAQIGLQVMRDVPRAGAAANVELVAGGLGGAGFHDGAARAARFDLPLGIAADRNGKLFVADMDNGAIRLIDRATGETSTYLPATGLGQPAALAFDAAGRLHVLDALHGSISLVTASGLTKEYAGTYDTPGALSKPTAMAFDTDGTVVVADAGNHRVVRVDLAQQTLVDIAGVRGKAGHRDGDKPLFEYPEGLALDGAGHAYVAEWATNDIREIALATGATRTLVGGFASPGALAYDNGALYVAESEGLAVRRVDVATRRVTTLAGKAAHFEHASDSGIGELPFGLAIADGALYMTDTGNAVVRRIALATGEVTTLAGELHDGLRPRAIAYGRDGQLYATMGQGLFRLHDGVATLVAGDRSDAGHGDGVGARARFKGPVGLAAAPDGSLVVAEINGQVRRVDPRTGAVKQLLDKETILRTVAVDAKTGAIVVGGYGALVELASGKAAAFAKDLDVPLHDVFGIALDGDIAYVLSVEDLRGDGDGLAIVLWKIDRAARTAEDLASWFAPRTLHSWPAPRGLALRDGALYIAHGEGAVTRFDLATRRETVVVSNRRGVALGAAAAANDPSHPTISPAGDLVYIDERAVVRVR